MPASDVAQVLEGFLKELLGAKKAVKLYPTGNPLAADWIQRLHRSHQAARHRGLPQQIRIANGRFEWEGGHLSTRDAALDAFRFELETRRINEVEIQPGVEPWELRDLLECLNLPPQEVEAAGGWPVLLERRNVVHIAVRGLGWGDRVPSPEGESGLSTTKLDLVDAFVAAVLELLEQEFRDLTDDGKRLGSWLRQLIGPEEQADVLFAAIEMLVPLIEQEPDRELRYRLLIEAIVALPDPARSTLAITWLIPRAWLPDVLKLLTRFSGEELAELTRLVPPETLEQLRGSLEEMPAEDWRKAWLRETLEEALAAKETPPTPDSPLIADGDPVLVQLGAAARDACAPDAVLGHSVDVFFQLLSAPEGDGYPGFLIDALEEAVAEALARDQLRLALRVLRALHGADQLRPDWSAEHQRRLHLLQRRLSGRSYISLLADLLRRGDRAEQVRDGAEYLRMLGREATEEFVALTVEEDEDSARPRMLDVLAAVGPAVIPAIRPWVTDSRWSVARQMVAFLSRLGDPAALPILEKLERHEHPQVRREVARALGTLGGRQAMPSLIGYLHDSDGEVRLTAIKLLGSLMDASAVAPLREFLSTPTRTLADLLVKREILAALGSIASPEARQILQAIADRFLWPWQRNERKVRELARGSLRTPATGSAREGAG